MKFLLIATIALCSLIIVNSATLGCAAAGTHGPCAAANDGAKCLDKTGATPAGTATECGCEANADCAHSEATGPKCFTTAKNCKECLADADCTTAAKSKCDTNACVVCTAHADCGHIAGKTKCKTGTGGACVECAADADCAANTANGKIKCHTTANVCGVCGANADCTDAATSKCADATQTCVVCAADADCSHVTGKTKCKTGTGGACVECNADADCTTAAKPKCSTSNACEAQSCTAHTDCKNEIAAQCKSSTCTGCESDSHCTGISGKEKCDTTNKKCIAGTGSNSSVISFILSVAVILVVLIA